MSKSAINDIEMMDNVSVTFAALNRRTFPFPNAAIMSQ